MPPQCNVCGQETLFVPQYQQWYCQRCNTYPFMPQAAIPAQQPPPMPYYPAHPYYPQPYYPQPYYVPPQAAPQPVQYAPPVVGPTVQAAAAKIRASVGMRQATDVQVPTYWAWIIVLFQIVLPVSAVITVYILVLGSAEEAEVSLGQLAAVILGVLLAAIGLAVANSILVYKLVGRRDGHFRRDYLLADGMGDHLAATSQATHIDLNVERWTLITLQVSNPPQDRSPGLWALLTALIVIIPIIGIVFLFYCLVFLTKDVHQHDERQRAVNLQYENALLKAGKIGTLSGAWQPLPKRDVGVYVVISILSLGLFLPYWWYVNIEDMNTHMRNQWEFENALIENLKAEV